LALGKRPAPLIAGARMAFHRVLFTVMPNGLVLVCSSLGFGGLTAFVALYFDSLAWDYAAWCLSGFGLGFILARLSSPGILQRFRGYKVVAGCLLVQTLGMLLIWLAPSPALAIAGGVLTGAGVSWVYPGLGVETLARTPPANRNSALSALSLFFDIAVGVAGPVMGLIASGFGYAAIFFCAAVMSAGGFVLVIGLCWRSEPVP
jgi:predicted MFS family arabinose efflux permease